MNSVYYWSPCLNKVGTYKATINSAISLARYSKNNFSVRLINVCGEWENEKEFLNKNNVDVINLGLNYFKFLPKTGYFKSRFSYIIIILLSIFPLIRLLIKNKPDFLIIHLLTSLPLFLMKVLRSKTKFILRISGYPKLNFLRRLLWKAVSKKIFKISCPSIDLKGQLSEKNIFLKSKLIFLPDPIIKVKIFTKGTRLKEKNKDLLEENYFISAGRLTKQKNFGYLIDEFKEFADRELKYKLFIFGDGEEKNFLEKKIKERDLENKVFLMGYSDEIYEYMRKAKAFILSSLWEDPGFVIIESAMCNLFVISSNCKNGPLEFLENGKAGLLYETNKKGALKESLNNFLITQNDVYKKKVKAKKNCMKYTIFRHYKILKEILIL